MKKEVEVKEKKKKSKLILGILRVIFFAILILFILVVCLQRFSNNRISFFNYRMFTVITGSMAPKYNIGDVLISKQVDPKEVKVGDTVSYLGKTGSFADKVITHEVKEIEKDANGKLLFHTQGLTNIVEDPIVGEDQLYGVVVHRAAILSILYSLISTSVGFYLFILIPLIGIIGYEFVSSLKAKDKEYKEKHKNKE